MDILITFLVVLIGWVFSLCLHEFSHALAAYYGGDYTVKEKGYLTFNPLKYTHPVYSLLLPLIFLLIGGLGLPGGAVYIERWRLRSRGWETAVSLAGPASNLLLAGVLAVVLRFAPLEGGGIWPGLAFLALLQIMALVLNLLPLPPLDGYGAISPYINPNLRFKLDQAGGALMWVFFLALWYVPFISSGFWSLVRALFFVLQLPGPLAAQGLSLFQFWR